MKLCMSCPVVLDCAAQLVPETVTEASTKAVTLAFNTYHQRFSSDSSCIDGHSISKPDWLVINGSICPFVAAAAGSHAQVVCEALYTTATEVTFRAPSSKVRGQANIALASCVGEPHRHNITADLMNALLSLR